MYRKIPKINPGAYIFQRPGLLRGLFLEGLIFGGAYLRRVFCVTSLGGLYLEGLIRGGAYFRNFTVVLLEFWCGFAGIFKLRYCSLTKPSGYI